MPKKYKKKGINLKIKLKKNLNLRKIDLCIKIDLLMKIIKLI